MSSFKATLVINDERRNVLNASHAFSQCTDAHKNTTTKPVGKALEVWLESKKDDNFLYEMMFSPTAQFEAELIFYDRDGMGILYKIKN